MPMVNVAESPFHYILAITDDWSELTVDIDDYEIPHLIIPKSVDGKVPHIIYIAGTVAALELLISDVLPQLDSVTWFSTEIRVLYVGV